MAMFLPSVGDGMPDVTSPARELSGGTADWRGLRALTEEGSAVGSVDDGAVWMARFQEPGT
jgi:hypothetical protein